MNKIKILTVLFALSLNLAGTIEPVLADDASANPAAIADAMPTGYRDWKLVSVAHEEGNLNDIRAILGNDIAIEAYRTGKLPFPDGAIIARIAWQYVPSEENNKAFGRQQSFIAGQPTNVQFMIKDAKAYASQGGWGFVQFNGGKPAHMDAHACFACHVPVESRDYVFTRYSP